MLGFSQPPQHSIFYKIVLTFLALLIPLSGLNLFMNDSGADVVRSEIVNSMNGKVELYVNLIESDFDRVINLIQAYVNDDDLVMLSSAATVMSDVEKREGILSLKSKIDLVKTSSRFVQKVSAFIPLLDRTVTSSDNYITSFDKEQFEALSVTTNRYDAPFLLWKGSLFISVPYPDPSEGRKPQFLLTVEVSERALREALEQFATNGEMAFLSSSKYNWLIQSGTSMPIAKMNRTTTFPIQTQQDSRTVNINGERYLVVSKFSGRLDTTLSIYTPEKSVFGSLTRYRVWLMLLTIVSIFIIVFFALSIYRIIQRPLRTLIRSLNKVERGNLNFSVSYPLKDEFGFLFNRFNAMVKQLNVLVHEVYEQKYRVRLAELRQLQSQINPHFLYNSFFILHRMAKLHDNDNIVRFTKYLGDYFQFITRDGVPDTALVSEVNNARTYTEIQAFRFGSRIRCEFAVLPAELEQLRVPRLILQPLIENAYIHGLENKTKDGWLRIDFHREEETFVIRVEDNGEDINAEKLHDLQMRLYAADTSTESTGLINVHRRIQIMCGPGNGVTLAPGSEGGLRVELRLPYRQEG